MLSYRELNYLGKIKDKTWNIDYLDSEIETNLLHYYADIIPHYCGNNEINKMNASIVVNILALLQHYVTFINTEDVPEEHMPQMDKIRRMIHELINDMYLNVHDPRYKLKICQYFSMFADCALNTICTMDLNNTMDELNNFHF